MARARTMEIGTPVEIGTFAVSAPLIIFGAPKLGGAVAIAGGIYDALVDERPGYGALMAVAGLVAIVASGRQ